MINNVDYFLKAGHTVLGRISCCSYLTNILGAWLCRYKFNLVQSNKLS